MKAIKILTCLSLAVVFILQGGSFGLSPKPEKDRKIVFEEIGQFNDGGMAVTILVVGKLAYVCEF